MHRLLARARDALRALPEETLLALVASAVMLVPVWSVTFLPLGDLGHHVGVAELYRGYGSVALYRETFSPAGFLSSNSTCYWLLALLYRAASPETAARLVVSAYVVSLPLAYLFMVRSLGAPGWLGMAAAAFLMNHSFTHGYLNFMLAMPLFFLVLGLFMRFFDAPGARRGAASLLAALLLYWTHALAYLVAMTAAGALAAASRRTTARGYLVRLLVPAVSSVPFFAWIAFWLPGRVRANTGGGPTGPLLGVTYYDPRDLLGQLFSEPHRVMFSAWDGYVFLALLGVLLVLVGAALARGEPTGRSTPRAVAVLAVTVAALLACPRDFPFEWELAPRLIPFVWLAALALVPRDLPRRGRSALVLLFFVALAADACWLRRGFREFDAQAAPVARMAPLVRPGAKVYRALFAVNDQSVMYNGGAYWHLDKYLMPWRRTVNQDILPRNPTCNFQFRPGKALPFLDNADMPRDPALGVYDYVVTFGAPPDVVAALGGSGALTPLLVEGKWGLFAVVKGWKPKPALAPLPLLRSLPLSRSAESAVRPP